MPLARYFVFVGAVLIAVLVFADAFLPKVPVAESVEPHHPAIRLYSDKRWPERVEFDTSVQMISSAQRANAGVDTIFSAPAVAVRKSAKAPEAADADRAINSRGAFAELRPGNMPKPQSAAPKKLGLENQRKIVRRQASQGMRLVWRQPSYGWYGGWASW